MQKKDTDTFCPASQQEWRQWLQENHQSKQSVWLVYYKKQSNIRTISWSQAVSEALCFGWIDSKRIALDEDRFMQLFTLRKPNSTWSKVNKEKIQQLIGGGLMTQAGYQSIERAKQNGSWTSLDEVEALEIPLDLEQELNNTPGALDHFLRLSKSVRKSHLLQLALSKRVDTRQRRINVIAENLSQKLEKLVEQPYNILQTLPG